MRGIYSLFEQSLDSSAIIENILLPVWIVCNNLVVIPWIQQLITEIGLKLSKPSKLRTAASDVFKACFTPLSRSQKFIRAHCFTFAFASLLLFFVMQWMHFQWKISCLEHKLNLTFFASTFFSKNSHMSDTTIALLELVITVLTVNT